MLVNICALEPSKNIICLIHYLYAQQAEQYLEYNELSINIR